MAREFPELGWFVGQVFPDVSFQHWLLVAMATGRLLFDPHRRKTKAGRAGKRGEASKC